MERGRGRGRRRRGESLLLLPFHHFCPISFTHFIPPLHVSPLCPALSSSLVLHHSTPSHPIPLSVPLYPPLRRATISGGVPSANSGGGHIASAAKWAPSSTRGLYNRVVANGERAVPQCLPLLFSPLPSSLTRGRLRCAVSKHRQLK